MVINVAAYPSFEKFWIYDVEDDKYEGKFCDTTVLQWEIKKVDQYFENIIGMLEKPINDFYLIIDYHYYNEIRTRFIEMSKKHGIARIHITSEYQLNAILALKFAKICSDSLWLFNCNFKELECIIWKKNSNDHFNVSELITQLRTTSDSNLMESDLQNLKKKICLKTVFPTIVVFQGNLTYSETVFKRVFSDYLNINFYKRVNGLYNLLQFYQNQKKGEITYSVHPMLGRYVEMKFADRIITPGIPNRVLPFRIEYKLNVKKKNMRLKVYENEHVTRIVNINKRGKTNVILKFDINGRFYLTMKRKGRIFDYLIPSIMQFNSKIKTTYKIPPKLAEYNKDLNAIGIDLGTSECCAFVIRRNGPEGVVLDSVTNQRNMPSYVAMNELNLPCGQNVVNRMVTKPEYSTFDAKFLMGMELEEIVIDPLWPFGVISYCEEIYITFGNKRFPPWIRNSVDISSCLLRHIKTKAEEFQGIRLEEAVITVPSSFTEKQKDATIDAATNNLKWRLVKLLPEPIAALFAYSYETEIPNESTVFLFDCGGGTTDICIAKIIGNKIDILSEKGDPLFGGKNFDRVLISYFNSVLNHKYGLNVLETNKKYRLMVKCQEIKHTLSVQTDANLFVDDFKTDEDDVIPITRKEFENMAADLICRAKKLIVESLSKAEINPDEINIVFQAGGGCRMQMIKQMLRDMFPKAQHQCSIHLEELVAKGAALYSYELKIERKIKEMMFDVFGF